MKTFYFIMAPLLIFLSGTNLIYAINSLLEDRSKSAAFNFFAFAFTLSVGIYNLIYLVNNY